MVTPPDETTADPYAVIAALRQQLAELRWRPGTYEELNGFWHADREGGTPARRPSATERNT